MAKRKNKFLNVYLAIVTAIVGIGIGSLFVDGALIGTMLLGWIPLIGHQIVGWTVISSSIIALIREFM